MRKLSLLFVVFLLVFTVSSCQKMNGKMTVVKNCTGTYLKYLGKSYLVCNEEVMLKYQNNDKVHATVKKITDCDFKNEPMCMYYYHSHGIVEVLKVKW